MNIIWEDNEMTERPTELTIERKVRTFDNGCKYIGDVIRLPETDKVLDFRGLDTLDQRWAKILHTLIPGLVDESTKYERGSKLHTASTRINQRFASPKAQVNTRVGFFIGEVIKEPETLFFCEDGWKPIASGMKWNQLAKTITLNELNEDTLPLDKITYMTLCQWYGHFKEPQYTSENRFLNDIKADNGVFIQFYGNLLNRLVFQSEDYDRHIQTDYHSGINVRGVHNPTIERVDQAMRLVAGLLDHVEKDGEAIKKDLTELTNRDHSYREGMSRAFERAQPYEHAQELRTLFLGDN
jgi:hypothetical protein